MGEVVIIYDEETEDPQFSNQEAEKLFSVSPLNKGGK